MSNLEVMGHYCVELENGEVIKHPCSFNQMNLSMRVMTPIHQDGSERIITREFLELENGDIIDTFDDIEEGRTIADGTAQDEASEMSALDYVLGRTNRE